jgi:alkylation response protein AidB-like acyl-CoA dehydrogenase
MSRSDAPLAGGEFLLRPSGSVTVFAPEQFSDEQRMYYETAEKFSREEVVPRVAEIEAKAPGVMVELLRKAGTVGLLGVDVPQAYGGLGADKTTSMLMTETITRVASFSVSLGAHTGIGTLPIVFFGTDAQKQRYLPRLASGEWIAAYALTEPSSGSDALAARTRADPTPDGAGWVLNGTKQFITNAAFADLFTVFAQVEGAKFTAFLVERGTPGVTIGAEEKKLGIRGSSTCQVILTDCRVPKDAVLGEIGRGHKIAFNILNVGRWKLGIGSVGAARECLRLAAEYAAVRRQFGRPIGEFGLVRRVMARIATLIFAGESMGYRLAGTLDARIGALAEGTPGRDAEIVRIIEDYTIEASILKVFGSEALDYAADEALQIHGGYGFTEEYPVERMLRDSRINRIFEGTNEINRLIVTGTVLKRAVSGKLPLIQAVGELTARLGAGGDDPASSLRQPGPLGIELRKVEAAKQCVLYALGFSTRKLGESIKDRQQVLGNFADALIDVFAMDSVLARTLQLVASRGEQAAELPIAMTRLFCEAAHERVFDACREIVIWLGEGEEFSAEMQALGRLYQKTPIDAMRLRHRVATAVLGAGGYPLRV